MRPNTEFILNHAAKSLAEAVAPTVTDPVAAAQLAGISAQLARIGGEWNDEAKRQQQRNDSIGALLTKAAAVLAAKGGEWAAVGKAAAATPGGLSADDGTMKSIYRREDELNAALVKVMEALEQIAAREPTPETDAFRAEAYGFLAGYIFIAPPNYAG